VSIGEDLAEARRRAGLTVTEVSQRTRIRETIIRGIERDSYAECRGDFYARGFIRAIAREVGADPGPLIRDYEAAHGAPAVAVADPFRPVTRTWLRERHPPNVTAVLSLALAIAVGFALYHFISAPGHASRAASEKAASGRRHAILPLAPAATPRSGRATHAREIVVQLSAIEDCWVEFTTPRGGFLFQSYVVAGASKRWTFTHAVDMRLGNPGGVTLILDGKNPLPPGTSHPVTLRLDLRGTSG
jgi:transcriptional regulator with XRE-family HTH domain